MIKPVEPGVVRTEARCGMTAGLNGLYVLHVCSSSVLRRHTHQHPGGTDLTSALSVSYDPCHILLTTNLGQGLHIHDESACDVRTTTYM